MSAIQYDIARTNEDLHQILKLQQLNLPENISPEEKKSQGFVTVRHDYDILKKMNLANPHIIAKFAGTVIGYALVMESRFRQDIEILIPMFDRIDLHLDSGNFSNYIVMGQVCIARQFRGQGVFQGLYEKMFNCLNLKFDCCITEVDPSNIRSIKAHEKIGFERLEIYSDSKGKIWELIIWKWK